MFCSNCGCRIPAKALKCPNCNTAVNEMEYCSGFWSELNQNSSLHINEQQNTYNKPDIGDDREVSDEAEKLKPQSVNSPLNRVNKPLFMKYAVLAEAAIIVILLLYSAISGAVLKHKLNESNERNSVLEEQMNRLSAEYSSLKQQSESKDTDYDSQVSEWEQKYNELMDSYNSMNSENEALKEELDNLRSQSQEQSSTVDDSETNNGNLNNETQESSGQTPNEQWSQDSQFQFSNPPLESRPESSGVFH